MVSDPSYTYYIFQPNLIDRNEYLIKTNELKNPDRVFPYIQNTKKKQLIHNSSLTLPIFPNYYMTDL